MPSLRAKQLTGEVNEIIIHTLKTNALNTYKSLVQQKNEAKHPQSQEEINAKIQELLTQRANWTTSKLDESSVLKLVTRREPNSKPVSITMQKLKDMAAKMRKKPAEKDNEEEVRNHPRV